ncbi:MAG TPA: type II secretion system F family protein [Pirellulales bacterium]|nr:type II secretion system F family protein [Pirellulales bacterium]
MFFFFSPRIKLGELSQLCRRLATSLEAGVEIRRVWARESTGRSSLGLRRHMELVAEGINRGETVADALHEAGGYFPTLFHELIDVGEQTGKLAEVLRRLAEHYEHQVRLRRIFMAAIAWPMLQLCAAVGVIGLLIFIMGFLPKMPNGKPFDFLGLGLYGTRGLVIYSLYVAAVVAVVAVLTRALRRGLAWTRPVQLLLIRTPGLGGPLQTLAMSKLAWTMYLTLEAGMDLLRALPLCLRSMGNMHYSQHTADILHSIKAGHEVTEAFADTRAFPREFLDSLEVGERAGRLPETMEILSREYQDRAQRALVALTTLAGFGVWLLVAAIIVLVIFQLFSAIMQPTYDALDALH